VETGFTMMTPTKRRLMLREDIYREEDDECIIHLKVISRDKSKE
jgi:hypothetical protein